MQLSKHPAAESILLHYQLPLNYMKHFLTCHVSHCVFRVFPAIGQHDGWVSFLLMCVCASLTAYTVFRSSILASSEDLRQ
jgi:hypothetical protein